MDDPAPGQANALEGGDNGRMAAPHMQQRRQLEVHGQLQLGFKQGLLAFAVQVRQEVVQADFTHGAELAMALEAGQPVAQLDQVCGAMLIQVHRVQAEGPVQVRVLLCQVP